MVKLDVQKAMLELGITEDFYKELLGDFLAQADASHKNLLELKDAGPFDEIAREGHALKGSAANLRIDEISKLGKAIEVVAKGTQDRGELKKLVEVLEEAIHTLRAMIG